MKYELIIWSSDEDSAFLVDSPGVTRVHGRRG